MKKIILLSVAFASIFASCQSVGSSGESTPQLDSVSTAFGQLMGANLKQGAKGLNLNVAAFTKSFEEAYGAEEVDQAVLEAANTYVQNYMMVVLPAIIKEAQTAYITELGKNTKLQKTESGMYYEITSTGDLEIKPTAVDTVEVNYKGTLIDGETFDSSYDRGEPASFPLNGVIKGWTEGIQLIGKGGKIKLYIPSELAYGEQGHALSNQLLVFEVELLDVKKGVEQK